MYFLELQYYFKSIKYMYNWIQICNKIIFSMLYLLALRICNFIIIIIFFLIRFVKLWWHLKEKDLMTFVKNIPSGFDL